MFKLSHCILPTTPISPSVAGEPVISTLCTATDETGDAASGTTLAAAARLDWDAIISAELAVHLPTKRAANDFILPNLGPLMESAVPGIPQLPDRLHDKLLSEPPDYQPKPPSLEDAERVLLTTAIAAFDSAIEAISFEEALRLEEEFYAIDSSLKNIQPFAEEIYGDHFKVLLQTLEAYRARIHRALDRKQFLAQPATTTLESYTHYYSIPWTPIEMSYSELSRQLQEIGKKMELPETREYFVLVRETHVFFLESSRERLNESYPKMIAALGALNELKEKPGHDEEKSALQERISEAEAQMEAREKQQAILNQKLAAQVPKVIAAWRKETATPKT